MSGFIFTWNSRFISSSSKKWTALSAGEAEYIAFLFAVQEAIWLRNLLAEIGFMQPEPTVIYKDNQACIKIILNDMHDSPENYHVKIHYHFSREMIKEELVKLVYFPTELMIADALTKALSQDKFLIFTKALLLQDTRIDKSGVLKMGLWLL
jgi:hypothetical protein